jgi:hypothetical protein
MSPHRRLPPASLPSNHRRAAWLRLPVFLVLVLLAAASTSLAQAQELRISTGNDLFSGNTQDDLYTFSVAIQAERGAYTLALRENAFTDRAAGVRFDETYLGVGRDVPLGGSWQLRAEGGLVHVGHGLFGQSTQNAVHRFLHQSEVELRYRDSELHPRLALVAERPFAVGHGLTVGPRVELDAVPGLRSFALAGAEVLWQPSDRFAVQVLAGGRYTETSFGPLEPHLADFAPVARLELALAERVYLAWAYNDYGDEREHLTIGYRLGRGGRGGEQSRERD